MIATQAEIRRMSSFCRTLTWVRLACRTPVQEDPEVDLVADLRGVVGDVAEVPGTSSAPTLGTRWTEQLAERRLQRPGRPAELEHLPPEPVDPLDGVAALRGEDLRLELLDVVSETVRHRLVRVHDPIHECVQRRAGAEREQLRSLLEMLTDVTEPSCGPP